MKDKIQMLLDEQIEKEIKNLNDCVTESEKSTAIKSLSVLHALRIEEAKIEQAESSRYDEKEMKEATLKSESRSRWINTGVQAGLTIASWIATALLVRGAYKFEETGVVKSPITRSLIPKMFLRK